MRCRTLQAATLSSVLSVVLCAEGKAGETRRLETPAVESTVSETKPVWQHWSLSETQWRRYEQLMRERRGLWSPNIDPVTALGVSTNDGDARRRLAELYVRQQFERTRKELAFQVAVDTAWRRLYPNTSRLDPNAGAAASSYQAERYALIVQPACDSCDELIKARLTELVDASLAGVDIHVVGTRGDDTALRSWVNTHPQVARALGQGEVTVNHGDSFAHLSQFPTIYRKNGSQQWAREL